MAAGTADQQRRPEQLPGGLPGDPSERLSEPKSGRLSERLWPNRWLTVAAAAPLPAAWALAAAWWTPRGPLSTGEVLAAMAIGLVLGAVCGAIVGSRWAMWWVPVVFAVVFELARIGVVGPTVDAPRLSTYGLLALAVGRGFHGLVALLPMVLGAALGAAAARQMRGQSDAAASDRTRIDPGAPEATQRRHARRRVRQATMGLSALLLVAFVALLARPASTSRIVNDTGEPISGSIAELTTVENDGRRMGLMLRGVREVAPVLLFLAGGPGGAERGAMRNHLESLERSFVVATWDQRGTGASYSALDPIDTLTLDSYIDDTLAVTDYLRDRFDQERIYVLGQSWGSTLGVLAVQRAPERYRAFIGVGQMVSQLATDTIFYEDTLAWALDRGDTGLAERLRSIGPPPYEDMLDYETALSFEHEVYPYDHSPNSEGAGGFSENFFVPEYTLAQQVHLLAGFVDTFSVLYPQLQHIDFRESATRLDVPVFVVQGAHEAAGRSVLAEEWFEQLDAPVKDLVVLDTSGHRPLFEQPDEFVDYMEDVVLTRTADD